VLLLSLNINPSGVMEGRVVDHAVVCICCSIGSISCKMWKRHDTGESSLHSMENHVQEKMHKSSRITDFFFLLSSKLCYLFFFPLFFF
jgi:Fe-S-cluster-containing dehydrogenase component